MCHNGTQSMKPDKLLKVKLAGQWYHTITQISVKCRPCFFAVYQILSFISIFGQDQAN